MYLSVIVPTYNRNDLLSKCLQLLDPAYQTIDASCYEVIVTDDSDNFNAKILSNEFNWTRFVEGPKRGPAANRNNGTMYAKGEWFIFIDDDCLPSADLLQAYYNEIVKGNYNALEGLIDTERPRERYNEEAPINLEGGCFWSCNIAVEKSIFKRLNGFDEGFLYPAMEDVDFFERLKNVSNFTFLESARVVHPWRYVKPFKNFKQRIISNRYMLNKYNVKRDFNYRFKRFKLFVGLMITNTTNLKKASFKGIGVYFDHLCFQFLMLFV